MKTTHLKEKADLIESNKAYEKVLFTNERIQNLPELIKKHLRIC